jgi:hypothetical protein
VIKKFLINVNIFSDILLIVLLNCKMHLFYIKTYSIFIYITTTYAINKITQDLPPNTPPNYWKLHTSLSKTNQTCVTNKDCYPIGAEEVCVDTNCQCRANYKLDDQNNCSKYNCQTDTDCRRYDGNRMCRVGTSCDLNPGSGKHCYCKPLFKPNTSNGDKCETIKTTIETNCTKDCDCISDVNQLCMDKTCRCKADYYPDNNTCVEKRCSGLGMCDKYDTNRYCLNGNCVCNDGYLIDLDNGKKCTLESSTSQTSRWGIYVVVGVIIFVILASLGGWLWYRGKKRKSNMTNHNTDTNNDTSTQYPIQRWSANSDTVDLYYNRNEQAQSISTLRPIMTRNLEDTYPAHLIPGELPRDRLPSYNLHITPNSGESYRHYPRPGTMYDINIVTRNGGPSRSPPMDAPPTYEESIRLQPIPPKTETIDNQL